MALKIDTQGKSLSYNGEVIPSRNVSQVEKIGQFIRIYLVFSSRSYIEIQFSDIYVDNVVFTDVDLALQFFQSNFFAEASQGGGVPTLGEGYFIVGGANGNELRKIKASDFGSVAGSGSMVVYYWRKSNEKWYSLPVQGIITTENHIPLSSTGGQLRFGKGTFSNSGVRREDIDGIINDTLTTSETAASLNAMYSSFGVSEKVTSLDNSVEYIKRSPTQWEKRLLTLV